VAFGTLALVKRVAASLLRLPRIILGTKFFITVKAVIPDTQTILLFSLNLSL
jgi:predicted nuclease with TOPRIM domain